MDFAQLKLMCIRYELELLYAYLSVNVNVNDWAAQLI